MQPPEHNSPKGLSDGLPTPQMRGFLFIKKSFKIVSQPLGYKNHFSQNMIVQILSLSLLMLFSTKQSNLIEWSAERKLTWNDFKAQPDNASTNAALTSSSINIEFGYNNTGLKYNIKCRFDKNLSWGRIKNDYILAHEQGHFDIAEIHARKLNKLLKAYKFNSRTVAKDVNTIYEKVMKEHHAFQSQYDQETNYSRDFKLQDEWITKIQDELKKLEEFAGYK